MTPVKTHILVSAVAMLLGACSSQPVAPTAAPKPIAASVASTPAVPQAAPAPAPAVTAQTATRAAEPARALPAHLDPNSELSRQRSVFFDFDASVIKPDFRPLIERHASYLMANPKLAIKIEGNTDERGGSEYNLALGQKRAESVRQALKLVGVSSGQMEAVSLGETSPKANGHTEADWSQNRRADIQYPKP